VRKRNKAAIPVILIALLIAADLFCTFAFYLFVQDGIRSDPRSNSSHAVVLFSGFDAAGKLDSETIRRLNHTVEHAKRTGNGLIICCGGARPRSGEYGSLHMRDYLLKLGFDPATVISETLSNSTHSNLYFAAMILEKHGIRDATVISSPAHMLRIKSIAAASGEQVVYQFAPYSYQNCVPPVEWNTIYRQIHHEFAAILASAVLPDRYYVQLLNWIRS
jgi:uncharacterized SAM-binding protein YcdF (DUF218 family)